MLEKGSLRREQYESQQPNQHRPKRTDGKQVPETLSEAVESVDGGVSAMTGTAERQPAGGRPETGSLFDGGIDHAKQQREEEIADGSGSRFAAPGVVAAVCTLLAMLLVGALVWVHVREVFDLGRTGKRKGRTTEEEAKRSKSSSRDKGNRTGKASDWDERRHGHEETPFPQKEEHAEGKEILSAEEDQENSSAGGFWPAREGRSSSTARRAGARALQQHVRPAVGGQHQHREYERDVQREGQRAREWFSEERESREAHRQKSQQQQQRPRGLCRGRVADDGENSTSSLSSDDGFRDRFQQSEVGETTEDCFNTGRSRGHRNIGSSNHVEKPQWRRLDSAMSNRDKDGAVHSTGNMIYSHREEVGRYKGNSSSNSPAAWGDASDLHEEGTSDVSFSFSVKEEENMLSPSELEDQVSPTPDLYPTQPDVPWFSTQVKPARSSAAIVSLQQQYEKKCRDFFARLGEVVEEAPVKAQTPVALKDEAGEREGTTSQSAEGTLKTSSGNGEQQRRHQEEPFRFERPAPLSEEAMTEAEQLLTRLEEMFADIKRDFKDNQPGSITCMIRCCNRLLEMDGLMVLSRCKKVPRLMQKAQSVIETVVPCIWSS